MHRSSHSWPWAPSPVNSNSREGKALSALAQDLENHILEQVVGYFPDLVDSDRPRTISTHVKALPFSVLVKCRLHFDRGLPPRTVLAKIPRRPGLTDLFEAIVDQELLQRARSQFEASQRIFRRFESMDRDGLLAPRPLDYLPGFNCILAEKLPGRPLDRAIRIWPTAALRRNGPLAAEVVGRCGKWLKVLHGIALTDEDRLRPFDAGESLAHVDGIQEALAANGCNPLLLRDLREGMKAWIGRYRLDGRMVPVARLHGDFSLSNVLVTPAGGVFAVDAMLRHTGTIYEDVAQFVVALRTTRWAIVAGKLANKWLQVAHLEMGFLRAYFEDDPIDESLLRLLVASNLLKRWGWVISGVNARPLGFLRAPLRRLRIDHFFPTEIQEALSPSTHQPDPTRPIEPSLPR